MTSKWTLVILAILAILLILYMIGNKSVHNEIIIDASPEEVWAILSDTDNYDSWNPVMKLVKGELREGSKVTYQFTQDEQSVSEITATVQQIIPYKLLNQSGGIPIVLTYNHKYILEPHDNGTKVIIHEDYRGIYVNFWNPQPVEEAYGRLNNALKEKVEKLSNFKN